ncbi:acyl carrier protein [Nonomuraea sp. NPDC050786]|uniref:acyl carrier protein n=1 Tax=Nonomuraea sp. NPDC050786 TaxID=3154840 RepID=UPI0033F4B747
MKGVDSMVGTPELEHLLDLFRDTLPGSEPTPESNFFALGGDSMTALEIADCIEERWGISIEVLDVIAAEDITALYRSCLALVGGRT